MAPDSDNPAGYWESPAFHDFHERLLRMASTRWDSWTHIPSEWLSDAASQFRDECLNLLRTEFGDAAMFVMKDPRMCRLLPFWIPTLTDAGINPSAILVIRNPHDVARSLERRNGLPRTTGLLLWLRHVLDAESHSRQIRRWIVRSEELVQNWRGVASVIEKKLEITWPAQWSEQDSEISRFVRAACRQVECQTVTERQPEPLQSWLNRTCEAMTALQGAEPAGVAAAMDALDEVRTQFDEVTSIVNDVAKGLEAKRLADVHRLEEHLSNVTSALKSAQLELETTHADLRATRSGLHAVEAELRGDRAAMVDLQQQLAASVAHSGRLETDRDALRSHAENLRDQVSGLEAERARLGELVAALYDSKSWRITAPLRAMWSIVTPRGRS